MIAIYDPKTFNPKTAIGGLVSRVKLKLFEAMEAELAPYDITAAQYVILVGLAIAFWPQILGALGIHVAPPGGG